MKVLIVSHNPFSKTFNNGRTLSSIFSSFRKVELCQLYFTPVGELDYDRCDSYYQITDKDAIVSIFKRKKCGSPVYQNVELVAKDGSVKKRNQNCVTLMIRSIIWSLSSWKNGGLSTWLSEQKPNLIFYVGGNSIFSHRIAVELSKELKVALVSYFTDDYVINPPTNVYSYWLKRYYKRTICQSKMLFAIGEQMAQDYSAFYNRTFYPVMNVVDIQPIETVRHKLSSRIHICYFGGLHLGRAEEIIRFANFLRDNLGFAIYQKIELKVFSFDTISTNMKRLFEKLDIEMKSGISGDNLKTEMLNADIFLHVESILPKYHYLTKLSVSTKIPEYMSFARPIIAFGPADVASFRLISSVNPELSIDDRDNVDHTSSLDSILRLIDDNSYLRKLGMNNYMYASSQYDKTVVAAKFRKMLECCF